MNALRKLELQPAAAVAEGMGGRRAETLPAVIGGPVAMLQNELVTRFATRRYAKWDVVAPARPPRDWRGMALSTGAILFGLAVAGAIFYLALA